MKTNLRLLMSGMILVCSAAYSRGASPSLDPHPNAPAEYRGRELKSPSSKLPRIDPGSTVQPAFQIRGIKGLWWDGIDKYRLALPWIADHGMNFLMFCYTSFPASGKDWRSQYTQAEQQAMRELASEADRRHVELCLSFNPGIWSKPPLTYASEQDYQLAWNKVKTVHGLGIHSFAICLDDINKKLEPADAKRFGTLQSAQVYFVNRLWHDMQSLSPVPRLIFCPSAYTTHEASQHLDYIKKIADLDPAIFIFWTGQGVCSTTITADDARQFAKWIGRKPIVWDNYPVNDMFPWRPLMAPVQGRSADLGDAVVGVMANPMKQWNPCKIPLATLAEYLADPAHYDPSKAMRDAIDEYPPDQRDAISALLAVYGTSFIGQKDYPPKPASDAATASAQLPKYLAAREKLSKTPGLQKLWRDVRPTLDADIQTLQRTVQH
jgi:hyaluronoglucosaminidase